MRQRLLVSIAVGLGSGTLCWYLLRHLRLGAADFGWAIQAAEDLLARRNPYDDVRQLYPLPAAAFGLPFIWLPPDLAGGIFYGISSALLSFGLTKNGYWRLLIFLAYPYWAGLLTAQWSPLIMASSLFPFLLPVTLAKPQVGLPIACVNLSWRRVLACFLFFLVSLVVMPHWPSHWLSNASHYSRFIPLLVLPGPLLLLAMLRYRDRDSHLFLLMTVMPQRWFYDTFILWLIPKTRRQIIWTVFFSWGAGIWRWYHTPRSFEQVGRWTVILIYIPVLFSLLLRLKDTDLGDREY